MKSEFCWMIDKFLDVLAIQETQLNNSHRDSEFYIPVLI